MNANWLNKWVCAKAGQVPVLVYAPFWGGFATLPQNSSPTKTQMTKALGKNEIFPVAEKIACKSCSALILVSTAERTGGVCMPCKNGTRSAIEESKRVSGAAKMAAPENDFVCLECGSTRCGETIQAGISYQGENPWSYVAARERCFDCGAEMPRALSRRWNNESIEEARMIWVQKYRGSRQGGESRA